MKDLDELEDFPKDDGYDFARASAYFMHQGTHRPSPSRSRSTPAPITQNKPAAAPRKTSPDTAEPPEPALDSASLSPRKAPRVRVKTNSYREASCITCRGALRLNGKSRTGRQRFICMGCGVTCGDYSPTNEWGFYRKPESVIQTVKDLLSQGYSIRKVMEETGLAKQTVGHYRRMFFPDGIKCPCGKDSRHQGWCRWRYQMSPARQQWRQQQTAARAQSAPPIVAPCVFCSSQGIGFRKERKTGKQFFRCPDCGSEFREDLAEILDQVVHALCLFHFEETFANILSETGLKYHTLIYYQKRMSLARKGLNCPCGLKSQHEGFCVWKLAEEDIKDTESCLREEEVNIG